MHFACHNGLPGSSRTRGVQFCAAGEYAVS
jgi:hypothetical protein